jgi:hypothetical protein
MWKWQKRVSNLALTQLGGGGVGDPGRPAHHATPETESLGFGRTLHLSSVFRQVAKHNGSAAQMQRVRFPAMAQGTGDRTCRLQRGSRPSGMCLLIWHPA